MIRTFALGSLILTAAILTTSDSHAAAPGTYGGYYGKALYAADASCFGMTASFDGTVKNYCSTDRFWSMIIPNVGGWHSISVYNSSSPLYDCAAIEHGAGYIQSIGSLSGSSGTYRSFTAGNAVEVRCNIPAGGMLMKVVIN